MFVSGCELGILLYGCLVDGWMVTVVFWLVECLL